MANTSKAKKETSTKSKANTEKNIEEAVSNEIVTKDSEVARENEALKNEMEALKAQLALLMKQATTDTNKPVNPKKEKNIRFVNMTNGTLVLKGSQTWTIDGQFKDRVFSEREALAIVNNMNNCIRSGLVYIADEEFVAENDLKDSYAYILSDIELKTLFAKNPADVVEIYKNVPDEQKEIIVRMIIDKRQNDEPIDANILVSIGRLSGKNLIEIEPLDD